MIPKVARTRMQDGLGLARRIAVAHGLGTVLVLVLASGCGPTASLDVAGPGASSSGTTSLASSGTSGLMSSSDGAPPPDVLVADLPAIPMPPGACPPGCTNELPLVWSWDDEPSPGGRLSAMLRAVDGSWIVATRRDGQSWITQLDAQGELVRSVQVYLGCDCEIIDLALYPSGEVGVLGEGLFDELFGVLTLARFQDDPTQLYEQRWDIIDGTEDRPGRVGALLPVTNEWATVLVTESGIDGDGLEHDSLYLFSYEFGSLLHAGHLDSQLAFGPPRRPLGVVLAGGELVLTLTGAGAKGTSDYVAWANYFGSTFGTQTLPGVADALAVDQSGTLVAVGHAPASPGQLVVQATPLSRVEPPAWQLEVEVPTTTTSAPVAAMDEQASTYWAVRTTAGTLAEPAEAGVVLAKILVDGTLAWSTTLPLAAEASMTPLGPGLALALALAHDEQDLVLAAFVDGRLHLEQREQVCECD